MAHVLVVDDEVLVAEFLASVLRDAGHRVTVAADRWRAEAADLADPCDLLATDVRMPGGGPALALAPRQRRPGLPVVVASGYLAEADGFLREPDGNTLALAKPLRAAELRSAVAFLLGTPGLQGHTASPRGRAGRSSG